MTERLKEIKEDLPYSIRYSGELEPIIEYAKEQAERVQELEETVEDYKKVNKELHQRGRKVRKQNKRYREALEEISQKRMAYADMAGVLRIAREALEGDLE